MIEQALQVLTLHIIWKSRALPSSLNPSAEDKKYLETFLSQRDVLIQRLTEFALGTQEIGNGVSDTVKRTVCGKIDSMRIPY